MSGKVEEPESIRGTTRAGGKVVGMTEPADWLTSGPMPNLGALLIGFLHLFGNELDLATVRLVLKVSGFEDPRPPVHFGSDIRPRLIDVTFRFFLPILPNAILVF